MKLPLPEPIGYFNEKNEYDESINEITQKQDSLIVFITQKFTERTEEKKCYRGYGQQSHAHCQKNMKKVYFIESRNHNQQVYK